LDLLSASEQQRVVGFVINRFRGDIALLKSGLDWLEARTGKPVLAVLPYLHDLYLEAEDALSTRHAKQADDAVFHIVVPYLPSFSNHTDFDPLQLHPGVKVSFVKSPDEIDGADLIVLPGSKSVVTDLARLRAQGWESFIQRHLRYGGKLLGICGGFQMLGAAIHDPLGLESEVSRVAGLNLLAMETTLQPEKCLRQSSGHFYQQTTAVSGYQIHLGVSHGPALQQPLLILDDEPDGALSEDQQIAGTYLHGLFDLPEACNALLAWAGYKQNQAVDFNALREAGIDCLADMLEADFDFQRLESLLQN
jgi:adenosylcobyric acid synthase